MRSLPAGDFVLSLFASFAPRSAAGAARGLEPRSSLRHDSDLFTSRRETIRKSAPLPCLSQRSDFSTSEVGFFAVDLSHPSSFDHFRSPSVVLTWTYSGYSSPECRHLRRMSSAVS